MSRQRRRRGQRAHDNRVSRERRKSAGKRNQWYLIGGGVAIVLTAVIAIAAFAFIRGGGPSEGDASLAQAGHTKGVETAPVTVLEFSDFQ